MSQRDAAPETRRPCTTVEPRKLPHLTAFPNQTPVKPLEALFAFCAVLIHSAVFISIQSSVSFFLYPCFNSSFSLLSPAFLFYFLLHDPNASQEAQVNQLHPRGSSCQTTSVFDSGKDGIFAFFFFLFDSRVESQLIQRSLAQGPATPAGEKKGRGRPRKQPASEAAPKPTTPGPKRGRGRPPKDPAERGSWMFLFFAGSGNGSAKLGTWLVTAPKADTPKGKRGRPKKNPEPNGVDDTGWLFVGI